MPEVGTHTEKEDSVEKVIFAPIQGNVIPRESIPDETVASGVLGEYH